MRDGIPLPPELQALRDVLRRAHPSFGRIDEILMQLAFDESVSPPVFDLVCEALFVVLMAYAETTRAE